jgi:hypothetical protein
MIRLLVMGGGIKIIWENYSETDSKKRLTFSVSAWE